MAKQGMKRPERAHEKTKQEETPVPQIQGKVKARKEKNTITFES